MAIKIERCRLRHEGESLRIAENLVLGIQLDLTAIGWAILDSADQRIVDAGVWTFSSPESVRDRTPNNHVRRVARSARRGVRRRRQRMNAIRDLLVTAGLLPHAGKSVLSEQSAMMKVSPWYLRAEGLRRRLTAGELATCLYHIAKHRGFQSVRKGSDDAVVGDSQKVLKGIENLSEQIAGYKTFGEALFKDEALSPRRRNTSNTYDRTPRRDWLRREVTVLFDAQRQFGSEAATPELEAAFSAIAFTQRQLKDRADEVRDCPFEPGERRAAKHAPSFEKLRFLSKLAGLRLYSRGLDDWALSAADIQALEAKFGTVAKFTYKAVRNGLGLDSSVRFRGVETKDEGGGIATRVSGSAIGTRALQVALGPWFDHLSAEQLDEVMFVIAFHQSNESVAAALSGLSLPQAALDALNAAVALDVFKEVKGAGHISAKACRNIIAHLRTGVSYVEACALAGYDLAAPDTSPLVELRRDVFGLAPNEIRRGFSELISDPMRSPAVSPVVRKALAELVKQFVALVYDHPALAGRLPGLVNLELAREVGKSPDERSQIRRGLSKRRKAREALASEFEATFGRRALDGSQDLLRFELAQEQGWVCLYSGDSIDAADLFDDETYRIDHILPWSRFADDHYTNLTLCVASVVSAKGQRTLHEWATSGEADAPDLDLLLDRVEGCRDISRQKRRKYALDNGQAIQVSARSRNLNDTQKIARLCLQSFRLFYPPDDGERFQARPGAMMSKVRQAWLLPNLKMGAYDTRIDDDRRHAMNALSVAAISEPMLQALVYKASEDAGPANAFERLPLPSPKFRDEVAAAVGSMRVARAEERRVSGQVHMETVHGVDDRTQTVFERVSPAKLLDQVTADALKTNWATALEKRFAKPERSQAIVAALVDWQRAGRPEGKPPLGPTGDCIRKIRVISVDRPAVRVRGGTAARGDMARVDVFSKLTPLGRRQYFLVPIYPHQVASLAEPPRQAIQALAEEADWPVMDESYSFEFSLFKKSWIEVTTPDGTVVEGYFRRLNRRHGAIEISPHQTLQLQGQAVSIGARTLLDFRKYQISRLGAKHLVGREQRAWRGKVFGE